MQVMLVFQKVGEKAGTKVSVMSGKVEGKAEVEENTDVGYQVE